MKKILRTSSSRETIELGNKIGQQVARQKIAPKKGSGALVLALSGDLGAGKTTFIQGFLRGLGVKKRSPSPTFIIFRRHAIGRKSKNKKTGSFSSVYHMDAYRLKDEAALKALDFQKILDDPQNILLVEWAEKIKKALPKKVAWLKFSHGKKDSERKIEISSAMLAS